MGALEQFESFLQDILERPAWLMSPRRLQPLEVASALTRELEGSVRREGARIVIPTDYLVLVAEDDLARLRPSVGDLEQEMTGYIERLAAERGLTLRSTPSVRIQAGSEVRPGQILVNASFGSRSRSIASDRRRPQSRGPAGSAALALLGEDNSEIERFDLGERSMTLGRRSDNDIPLTDTKISRHHARLEFDGGTYYLTDLGSTNGTRINGREIGGRCALQHDDVIEVGLQRFRFTR
jgi:hypothetical protein